MVRGRLRSCVVEGLALLVGFVLTLVVVLVWEVGGGPPDGLEEMRVFVEEMGRGCFFV